MKKLHTRKLPILNAFNKKDLAILQSPSLEVEESEFLGIKPLIRDMHFTLDANKNGVGLAAPQVGINKRLFIIHYSGCRMTVINPVMLSGNSNISINNEGCLSVPGIVVPVLRHDTIKVTYTNLVDGEFKRFKEVDLNGWLAIIFQHEFDHLLGKLLVNFSKENGTII